MPLITDELALTTADSAVLLYSGGFDSTLVALLLTDRDITWHCVTIDYIGRPESEKRVCEALIPRLQPETFQSVQVTLADARTFAPHEHASRHEAWFPHRNTLFFSIGAHAAALLGANVLAAGTRVWDTTVYDDARREYFELLMPVIARTGQPETPGVEKLFLPVLDSHEPAIRYLERNGPEAGLLRETWSCWRNGSNPCGECAPCRTRIDFFANLSHDRWR